MDTLNDIVQHALHKVNHYVNLQVWLFEATMIVLDVIMPGRLAFTCNMVIHEVMLSFKGPTFNPVYSLCKVGPTAH